MFGFYIHKEGKNIIAGGAAVALAFGLWCVYAVPLVWLRWGLVAAAALLWVFTVCFFRMDRRRKISAQGEEAEVMCPADGRVADISTVFEDEYFKCRCVKVSVFMSVWNMHVNRYPVSGKIVCVKYHPGKYLLAFHPKSSVLNEHTTVVIKTAGGREVLVRQIAGYVARRIACYAEEGGTAERGAEMGFIRFGSRVDVFLPEGSRVEVKLNDKVKAGTDIIAVCSK